MCVILFPQQRGYRQANSMRTYSLSAGMVGHDSRVATPIAASVDGRWAAMGSDYNTIIVWDLQSGSIYKEWFIQPPHHHHPGPPSPDLPSGLNCLSFSPDSLYLISTGPTLGATVWDFHRNACKVLSLGDSYFAQHCAWSPDGSFLVVAFLGGTSIRVWETSAFLELLRNEKWGWPWRSPLVFSPDGRWMFTATPGIVHFRNVVSRNHTFWSLDTTTYGVILSAAFHPGSTHLVVAFKADEWKILVLNVETGDITLTIHTS